MDKDTKKCSFLLRGEEVIPGTKPAEVCSSGSASQVLDYHGNESFVCDCLHAGEASKDPKQCCSGTTGADGKCGCLAVNEALEEGAEGTDCCTKVASIDGICRCAAPGAPIPHGKSSECCAGADASKKFCGCFSPDAENVVESQAEHCCGCKQEVMWLFQSRCGECCRITG